MTSKRSKRKAKRVKWSKLAREQLATYDLTTADAQLLGIEELSPERTAQLLRHLRQPPSLPALWFRYYKVDGTPHEDVWRVRFLELPKGSFGQDSTLPKYVQAPDTPPAAYWPKTVPWDKVLADTSKAILITEGEGKAACAAKHRYPCIGLGGDWSWKSKKHGWVLLPELLEVDWRGREVVIIYDSDARDNDQVRLAASELSRQLRYHGAQPWVIFPPDIEGEVKVGLDDFIRLKGESAFDAFLGGGEAAEVAVPKPLNPADLHAVLRYNAWDLLSSPLSGEISLNNVTQEICLDRQPWAVEDLVEDLRVCLAEHRTTASKEGITDAVARLARANGFHPVREYLESLPEPKQEGTIAQLVKQCLHLTEPLDVILLRRFLIGAVARVLDPGCKMDTALILVGTQGWLKSTFFAQLFGQEYFGDTVIDLKSKDALLALHRCWCYEWQELSTYRHADTEQVKGFLSAQADYVRPPYGRTTEYKKRWTVIVGSTNDEEFLTDPTGSRRFWPVRVPEAINLAWLRDHRDEVWAEAAAAYRAGEPWWFDEGSREAPLLRERHDQHELVDLVEERIRVWLEQRRENDVTEPFTLVDVADGPCQAERVTTRRIAVALRRLGYRPLRPPVTRGRYGPTLWVTEAWVGEVRDLKSAAVEALKRRREARKKKF